MRYQMLIAVALLASCSADKESQQLAQAPVSKTPRPPVALYGDWVQVAPRSGRSDTLTLHADSTARGVIPWDGRLARVTHWKIVYGSRDPVTARADWRSGYKDGGDVDCSLGHATDCVSMPMMCMGVPEDYLCQAFKFVAPDSLLLSEGQARFVRVGEPSRVPAESLLE